MPTTLHRITTTPTPRLYAVIRHMAQRENKAESVILINLAETAVNLLEDMADAEVAIERLRTFDETKALTTEEMLEWNRKRAAKHSKSSGTKKGPKTSPK